VVHLDRPLAVSQGRDGRPLHQLCFSQGGPRFLILFILFFDRPIAGMKIIKQGGHRLFEDDPQTSQTVAKMLVDLEKNGMDAVRKYSKEFDDWSPKRFDLSADEIKQAIGKLEKQVILDTEYCQGNVRRFAEAQKKTLLPLEVESRPGVWLGHSISR
jgi:histidinol dehydrogenase